jgi:hypothetical protein
MVPIQGAGLQAKDSAIGAKEGGAGEPIDIVRQDTVVEILRRESAPQNDNHRKD